MEVVRDVPSRWGGEQVETFGKIRARHAGPAGGPAVIQIDE
jgi:hypothetical protein